MQQASIHREEQHALHPALVTFVTTCFFVSGATGLMYEVLWTRMLILIFGATTFAISTVLTVFMAGLALGSYVLGRRLDRVEKPLQVYGILEILVGIYAFAAPFIFDCFIPLYRFCWVKFSPSFFTFSLIRFILAGGALLVPTFLMGGTLPALSRFCVRRTEQIGAGVGRLYALNTLGAVLGAFSTGFIFMPWLGTSRCILLASATNIILGILVVGAARFAAAGQPPFPSAAEEPSRASEFDERARVYALWALAVAGFAGMTYEVAWSRTLQLVIGSSVYAFTTMLTAFLVGIGVGSYACSRWLRSREGRAETIMVLHILIGLSAYATTFLFGKLPYVFTVLFKVLGQRSQGYLWGINFGIAFLVMLPATLFSGAVFPIAVRVAGGGGVGRSVGRAYACNTVGAILGAFCAGWLLIPHIGILSTILMAISLNLCIAFASALIVGHAAGHFRVKAAVCSLVIGAAAILWHPAWNRLLMSSGMYKYAERIKDISPESFYKFTEGSYILKFYKEGATATVTVAQDKGRDNLWLALDGKIDASSVSDMPTQVLNGHLPLLFAKKADSVLIVGFASGVTVGSVLRYPVKRVVSAEIESAVIEASYLFAHVNHRPWDDPRLKIVEADVRNYLLVTDETFDVIISEPSNPWIPGAANLFTKEFFTLGRSRLAPDGLFCQWVQLYGLAPSELRTVLRTFRQVFEYALVFETMEKTDLVIVGSRGPLSIDYQEIRRRTGLDAAPRAKLTAMSGSVPDSIARTMGITPVSADLARVDICSTADLLSYFKMGWKALPQFADVGPLNTDDNALIEFAAPKTLHWNTRDKNDDLLEKHADSVADYLVNYGATPADRAKVLLQLAEACTRRKCTSAAQRLAIAAEQEQRQAK
ncbi:MAG: fused MFS/spermidine synthase [Planctomycetota bacterium]